MKDFSKQILLFSTKSLILLVLLTIFVLIGMVVIVEPSISRMDQSHELTVDGIAKKYIQPDVAYINISAIFTSTNAGELKKQADAALTQTTTELKALNIAESKIKTSYNISPKYDKDSENIIGYTVNPSLVVKANDFSLVDQVILIAGKNKLDLVNSVYFTLEDPVTAKEQLRDEAIVAAKDKAKKLSQETGIRLGNIINISENSYQPYYSTKSGSSIPNSLSIDNVNPLTEPETDSTFSPGETEISLTIYLTYSVY